VREVTEGCAEIGVEYLTLYAFSTENWSRPKLEIDGLMRLLVSSLRKELTTLNKNDVRLLTIGGIENLPKKCQTELTEAIENTKENNGLQLILALNYSGRWELINAVKQVAAAVQQGKLDIDEIDESLFSTFLETAGIPDPELLIRTSGELRVSNFLLWQIAYTELYMTPVFWPDFRKEDLVQAIQAYQSRERRFGRISAQVNS
ncbi:MAG: polyprenyl diphosphate synthase, partial [Cyclobacteriaceae bacterium]